MKSGNGLAWARVALPLRRGVFGSISTVAFLLISLFAASAARGQSSYRFATSQPLGSSQTQTVTVTFQNAGVVSTLQVVSQGGANLDFTQDTSVSVPTPCGTAQLYAKGDTCDVAVKFAPRTPGARQGAVVLSTGTSALATVFLSATGQGAMEVMSPGLVTNFAGDGAWTYDGKEGEPARAAPIFLPMGGVFDAAGNFYFADSQNNLIRMVNTAGNIHTVAGTSTPGFTGDGGLATAAELSTPSSVVVDGAGNLYISDTGNDVIRRVDAVTHFISTVAGQGQHPWFYGDGGQATAAYLDHPQGLAVDGAGNLYIADAYNSEVRKIDVSTGTITAYAGVGGSPGYTGEGLQATASQLDAPWSLAFGPDGSLYIADFNNNRARKVEAGSGNLVTVAGTGTGDYSGDDGPATSATLQSPGAVLVDPAGSLYIADSGNNVIRKVNVTTGIITTIVPNNDGLIYGPFGLAMDATGNLYIADMFHNLIRMVSGSLNLLKYDTIRQGRTSPPQPETIENDGNDTMTLTQLNKVSNVDLDPSTTQACANGETMVSGSFCNLGVEFLPTVTGNPVAGQLLIETTAFNTPATVNLQGEVLSVDPTETTLKVDQNPASLGATITFTATVSWTNTGTVIPTGSVKFLDGTNVLGTSNLSTQAVATFQTSTLGLGSHTITAVYSGDDNNFTSTSAAVNEVVKQPTATALVSGKNPSDAGASVTFTATVTAQTGTPTGSVTFKDGNTTLGSGGLSGGVATYSTANLTAGSHTITAVYTGDSVNNASTSNTVTQAVQLNSSTTTLQSSDNNVVAGTSVTLTAHVTGSGPAPTGQVQFLDGATVLQTVVLDGSGQAQATISTLTVGTHQLTAAYQGDGSNAKSTSTPPLPETITQISTTTSVGASPNPASAGARLTLTATVTPTASTGGTIGGTVSFKEGTTVLGTGTVDGAGVATANLTTLAVGSHSIVAVYNGATNFATSTSTPLSVTIQQATTGTALISSQNPQTAGKAVTFTATVTGNGGIPGGTVTFKDGATVLGSGTLNAQGVAVYSTSALTAGGHNITAVYGGDVNDVTSTSPALVENISQTTSTTVLNASPLTANQGATVTLTATVSGSAGTPGGTVQFEDGATVIGTGTLNAAGVATYSTAGLATGSHTITAVYGGDTNHSGSTSSAVTVKILPTTAVSLTSNLNPAPAGATVTLTAAVSGQAAVPTGTVTFKDGATVVATAALDGSGRTSVSTAALAIGTHSLTASYSGDGSNAASVSSGVNEQIVQATTQTALTSSSQSSPAGTRITLTATVTGNGGVPGGTVNFKDGATVIGSGTLNAQGIATLNTTTLNVASHPITAVYAGDTNDGGSTSSTVTVVIQQAATTIGVSSGANPSTATVPVTLHAAITGGDAPTGTVTWKDGGTVIGTTAVDASGNTALTTGSLAVGSHNITASYGGDTNNAGSESAVFVQSVTAATSTVALTSNPNPSTYQGAVTLTATVSAQAGTPTGTVTFSDGATVLGTAAVNGAGVATLNVSSLSIGAHSIVAAYGGDANHSASQSAAVTQNVLQATTTVLTSSANPATASTNLTLTATVTGQNSVAATGTVTFKDGATVLGSATVNGAGVATLNTNTLAVGPHSITAVYGGDAKNQASSSTVLNETIISATTQVTLTASANPATAGAPVTFTARVVSLVNNDVNGSVTFMDGTSALGSSPLGAGGVATLTTATLAPGPHTITAVYSGDGENSTSTSNSVTESVLQVTTTALASSLNPAMALDAFDLTATVANGSAAPATGTVTFTDGTNTLGTVTLSGGVAVLHVPSLLVGTHPIKASYAGDAQDFASSSTTLTETVQLRPTSNTLTATTVAPGTNSQVTMISVVRWSGPVAPTGTITFTSGSTLLGTSPVDSTGVGTLTVNLPNGAVTVVSSYSGDASYAASSSTPTSVSSTTPTMFTITADPSSATIQSKQYTVIHLTITSQQGFADTMKLGCLGLPFAATCTFSADSIGLPANGKQTVTLTLDTGSPLTAGGQAKLEPAAHSNLALAWLLPGGLLLGLVGWRGRKRLGGLVLLLLMGVALSAGLTGCAAGLNVSSTPAGSYTIKVSATGNGSGATEVMDFHLTVQ